MNPHQHRLCLVQDRVGGGGRGETGWEGRTKSGIPCCVFRMVRVCLHGLSGLDG